MNKSQNDSIEKLTRLCNALADDMDSISDEEMLAELEEAGEDGDAIAKHADQLITEAIAKVGRRKLESARAGYVARHIGHHSNILQWPVERKRHLIQHFAQNDAALDRKLTLAARKGKNTETDIDSFIEDLIDLGVIDADGNVK